MKKEGKREEEDFMYNYRRNLLIFSIALLILGVLRSISFVMSMGVWPVLFENAGEDIGMVIFYLVSDLLTSFGAVISAIIGIVLRKKDKGLIKWSILSFIIGIMFLTNTFIAIGNSSGEYSSYSSRRAVAYMGAAPILQGICYIGVEKNWAEKMKKYQQ